MKSLYNPLKILVLIFLISFQAVAQNSSGSFFDLLYNTPKDASTFLNGYLGPVFKGFEFDLNSGWYTTAKTHKPLGLDISLSVNMAFVPSSDYYFKFNNSDYNNFQLASGTEANTPTVLGPNESTPQVQVVDHDPNYGDVVLANLNTPNGIGLKNQIGFSAVPAPMLQLGIGLIKNTDLKIRYIPDVSNQVDYSFWGIGIMHDLTQWIPVVNKLPIDISLFGGFTKLKFNYPTKPSDTGFDGQNQNISSTLNALDIEAIVSKKISVLTLLAAVGYNNGSSKFNIDGTYIVPFTPPSPPPGYSYNNGQPVELTNPVALSIKSGGMKATLGLRLQFAVFYLNADYTLGKYNVLNTGLGFTFR